MTARDCQFAASKMSKKERLSSGVRDPGVESVGGGFEIVTQSVFRGAGVVAKGSGCAARRETMELMRWRRGREEERKRKMEMDKKENHGVVAEHIRKSHGVVLLTCCCSFEMRSSVF